MGTVGTVGAVSPSAQFREEQLPSTGASDGWRPATRTESASPARAPTLRNPTRGPQPSRRSASPGTADGTERMARPGQAQRDGPTEAHAASCPPFRWTNRARHRPDRPDRPGRPRPAGRRAAGHSDTGQEVSAPSRWDADVAQPLEVRDRFVSARRETDSTAPIRTRAPIRAQLNPPQSGTPGDRSGIADARISPIWHPSGTP